MKTIKVGSRRWWTIQKAVKAQAVPAAEELCQIMEALIIGVRLLTRDTTPVVGLARAQKICTLYRERKAQLEAAVLESIRHE